MAIMYVENTFKCKPVLLEKRHALENLDKWKFPAGTTDKIPNA